MKNLNATKLQILALALSTLGVPQASAGKPGGGPSGGSSSGVITIDQSNALAGDVTDGDAPGFPVTLSQPGSYRLESNLTIPDTSTSAIEITADDVTIDFNGFAVLGQNVCASAGSCLVKFGTGHGINTDAANVTVFGGTVRGMGGVGLKLGRNAHIERMHLTHNGDSGIKVGQDSTVSDNTVDLNGSFGIWAKNGSLILRNVIAYNFNGGFFNNIDPGKVAIGANVFQYNLIQPWVGNPVHLLPNACFGNNCQ